MALLEFCQHLEDIATALRPFESNAPFSSYRIDRIRQNLRLDLPGLRDGLADRFRDGEDYPGDYPIGCGPNVPEGRESIFLRKLGAHIDDLREIVRSIRIADEVTTLDRSAEYVSLVDELWGGEGYDTAAQICNRENATPRLPDTLCRYMDLKTFLKFTLFNNLDETADWTLEDKEQFLMELSEEKPEPGKNWKRLSELWKLAKDRITRGNLEFNVLPKSYEREIKFFGQGQKPIHLTSPHHHASRETLHHVIRELALPGWEREGDREMKLGCVAFTVRSDGFLAYRPTMLDLFGSQSYFFLPGKRAASCGQTWRLTQCLCFNSPTDHGGHPEWAVVFPKKGIPCVQVDALNRPVPTYRIAGLAFGENHAELFSE